MHTQELGAAHSLHSRTVDGQRSMLSVHSPEVNNNLLRLLHIQREIVVTAPPGQVAHLAPLVCLISVADETHHSRVIRKLKGVVDWFFSRLDCVYGVQSSMCSCLFFFLKRIIFHIIYL